MIFYNDLARYAKVIEWYSKNYADNRILDSLSISQIESKEWMIEQLVLCSAGARQGFLHIEVVGSWFGWPLVDMLCNEFNVNNFKLYDIDPAACRTAIQYREIYDFSKDMVWVLNEDYWNRKPVTKYPPHLVINTSSEHMKETFASSGMYPNDCVFAIQSNDMYDVEEHVNCVSSLDEMKKKHALSEILYEGTTPIMQWNEDRKIVQSPYTRFMIIGRL